MFIKCITVLFLVGNSYRKTLNVFTLRKGRTNMTMYNNIRSQFVGAIFSKLSTNFNHTWYIHFLHILVFCWRALYFTVCLFDSTARREVYTGLPTPTHLNCQSFYKSVTSKVHLINMQYFWAMTVELMKKKKNPRTHTQQAKRLYIC